MAMMLKNCLLFSLKEEKLNRYRRMADDHILLYDPATSEFFLYQRNPDLQGIGLLIDGQPYEFVAANTDNKGQAKKHEDNHGRTVTRETRIEADASDQVQSEGTDRGDTLATEVQGNLPA